MKVINVYNLQLQIDADQITSGCPEAQGLKAVELINAVLQREPYGLGAQLFVYTEEVRFEEICWD